MSNKVKSQEEHKSSSLDQPTSIILYLNEKIKILELENNELKKEISSKSNEKDKISYYLRLRKDMIEQIESLKKEMNTKEIHYTNEIDKLNEIIKEQNNRISENALKIVEDDLLFNTNTSKQIQEKENKSFSENRLNTSKQNKSFYKQDNESKSKTKFFSNFANDTKGQFQNLNNNNTSPQNLIGITNNLNLQEETGRSKNVVSTIQDFGKNNIANNAEDTVINSTYAAVINDLETKLNTLQNNLQAKEEEIKNLKGEINTLNSKNQYSSENLAQEIENWKSRYLSLMNFRKTLGEEFNDHFKKNEESIKKELDQTIHNLQKKILHFEKLTSKYESDLESLSKQHSSLDNNRQIEIENLKHNLQKIHQNYEILYKTYEEHLKTLHSQIDNMKNLYLTREFEFLELTEYYSKAIEEYSKPLADINKKEKLLEIQDNYSKQSRENEEMKKKIEEMAQEHKKVKAEALEAKTGIRMKISESMKNYETSIKDINVFHSSLKDKLLYVEKFVVYFEEQFKFFNSLLEDKKILEDKVMNLECDIKMLDINSKEELILNLKEENVKLTRELEVKSNLVKEYELLISENINTSNQGNTKKAKEISNDILFKLNTEISVLTNQVVNLNKSKESLENFYKTELKNALDKIKVKSDKIDELQNYVKKLQYDFSAKKETIFNLWMLEFKEFKQNILTLKDIKVLCERFDFQGEEIKIHSERIYSEELLMLRDEMKVKDKIIEEIKKANENERKNLTQLVDGYNKTMTDKQSIYDKLVTQKQLEINSLKSEKEKLVQMEKRKKELTDKEVSLWNEQKEYFNKIVSQQFEAKNKEIEILRNQIEIANKENLYLKETYQKDIDNISKSIESQLILVKERESFTVVQFTELEERFSSLKQEKDRMIMLLKEELDEMKSQNTVLSRLKTDQSVLLGKLSPNSSLVKNK